MRTREDQQVEQFSVVKHLAKEFSRFLNRVQNEKVDILGSFLIENEWEEHVEDAEEAIRSLDLAGFVIVPRTATDDMVAAADKSLADGLMGQRGAHTYVNAVFNAMVGAWIETQNQNLILDIISMAFARASNPASKRRGGGNDSSFQRFRKHSQDLLMGLERAGQVIVPDEATPEMVQSGVAETAEIKTNTTQSIGADPAYLASLYENMVKARPQ